MDVTVALAGSPQAEKADFLCNGTDDEVEINDAIAAVGAAGGGTVHLAAGAYVTSGPIAILDNNVSLAGAGPASTTITAAADWHATSGPGGANITGIVTFCGVDNFSCSGITVNGDLNNLDLVNGIIAIPDGPTGTGQQCTNGVIENNQVFLDQSHTYSIWNLRGEHVVIQNNVIDGHSTAANNSISQEGIELFGARDVVVLDNIVRNMGNIGINVGGLADTVPDSVVDGVRIEGNTVTSARSGVHLATTYDPTNGPQDVRNVIIANNNLSDLTEFGIWYHTLGGNAANPPTLSNIDIHDNVIDIRSTAGGSVPAAFWFYNGEVVNGANQVAFADINIHDNSITIERASPALYSEDSFFTNNSAYLVFLGVEQFNFYFNDVVALDPQASSDGALIYGSSGFIVTANTLSGAGMNGARLTFDQSFLFNNNHLLNWDQANDGSVGLTSYLSDSFDSSGNVLLGGPANHWLYGGAGNDTFVIDGNAKHEVILDLASGAGAGDVIDLDGTSFANFAAVQSALSWTANGLSLNLGDGDSVILRGKSIFDLAADDFAFTNVKGGPQLTSGVGSVGGHDLQGDFFGNGQDEPIWRDGNNQLYLSHLVNGTLTAQIDKIGGPIGDYRVVGTGDFNHDGKSDILFERGNSEVAAWLVNGTSSAGYTVGYAPGYELIGTGDFDGNGYSDMLWRQTQNGQLAIWKLGAAPQPTGQEIGGPVSMDWNLIGTGDFNGDGHADILFRNNSGQLAIWSMNADGSVAGHYIGTALGSAWQVTGVGDINGDHIDDIIFMGANGQAAAWEMRSNSSFAGAYIGSPVPLSQVTMAGVSDVNGDGKADLVFRYVESDGGGGEAVWLLNGFTPTSQADVDHNHHAGWLLA